MDAMAGPFTWGRRDCCLAASVAFDLLHSADPMAGLHHQYHDRRGAVALIRARGGFDALCRVQALRMGLRASDEASGAIGVIQAGRWRVLALCIKPGLWAAKAPQGAQFITTTAECCWDA